MKPNETLVKDAVKWLFAKRRPDWPPDPLVLKAWVEDLVGAEGMTDAKVMDGCNELARSGENLDLSTLFATINMIAARKHGEEKAAQEKKEWADLRQAGSRAPEAAIRAIAMLKRGPETPDEVNARREALLDAYRQEAMRHPKGSTMRQLWIQEGQKYQKHCEFFTVEHICRKKRRQGEV